MNASRSFALLIVLSLLLTTLLTGPTLAPTRAALEPLAPSDVADSRGAFPGDLAGNLALPSRAAETIVSVGPFARAPAEVLSLSSVSISGPTTSTAGSLVTFTATAVLADPTASWPITYTWHASEQSGVVHPNVGRTDAITYSWATTGTMTITVTAADWDSVVADTFITTITGGPIISDYQQTISPTLKGSLCSSVYTITNQSGETATTVHTFYDEYDQVIHTLDDTVAASASLVYNLAAIPELPLDYSGYVIVSADRPFSHTLDVCPTIITPDSDGDGIPDDVECPAFPSCEDTDGDGMPDYLDLDDDGDGIPSADEYNDPVDPNDDFCSNTVQDSDADGVPDCQDNDADGDGIPNYVDVDSDDDGVPDALEGAGDSDGNGVLDYLEPDSTSSFIFQISPVFKGSFCSSVYTITNQDDGEAASIIHSFFDKYDQIVQSLPDTVPAGASQVYDLAVIPGFPLDYSGYVIVSADRSFSYTLDVCPGYHCVPVSDVQLGRAPAGDLFTGNNVRFMAEANGTTPFTHTWTLDGVEVGADQSTFEHTFTVSGTFVVGMTAVNACGQKSATLSVDVRQPAPEQPDLSSSYKSVNLTNVEQEDVLTYTLVLRNSSAVTATATLTDPLPPFTQYVADSAWASDGSMVTLVAGQLLWSGRVILGTPVYVQFAVRVMPATVGAPIVNVARLDDGLGNELLLEASSIYNPGYGLTIDDGALYTNSPIVTLGYTWNAPDGITHVKFSNDGGFGPGSGTTDWMAVNPADLIYAKWTLATYWDLRMPRTVYARFRDRNGHQYGPIQDDIVYDADPPQASVEIITGTLLLPPYGAGAVTEQEAIIRVTAGDENSGVSEVQVSHDLAFVDVASFQFNGPVDEFPWTLQDSGLVYVRIIDRAGNWTLFGSRFEVYLPLVVRNG